tara:strand:+ start:53041 stop:53658 length:618 start_codon:yes stop_codon:yes gene_type:complete
MISIMSPDFPSREGRGYLHTTDMYDFLIAGLAECGRPPADGPISLLIRKKMFKQADFYYADDPRELNGLDDVPAQFTVTSGGQLLTGCLRLTDRPVNRVEPYDEKPIRAAAEIEGNSIWATADSGATPIEVATSLNLRLHEVLFPCGPDEKWYDVRVDLHRPFMASDAGRLKMQFDRSIGRHLTRSFVLVNDETVGAIFFSLGKP